MEKIYLVCGGTYDKNYEEEDSITLAFKNRNNAEHYLDKIRKEFNEDTNITIFVELYTRGVSYSVSYIDKCKCRKTEKWSVKKIELAD